MSTLVAGLLRRDVSPDSFVDITGEGVRATIVAEGLSFDADLTSAQVDAIHDRMTSRDDEELRARATIVQLRTDLAAADLSTATGLETMRRAVLAGLDFVRNA